MFLCAAEVVVCAHTLFGRAEDVVVVHREADKRVGGNIYTVFIKRSGVDNAIAGAEARPKGLCVVDSAHGSKDRVGALKELALGGIEGLLERQGLAA